MSWGKTIAGDPATIVAEFKKFSDSYASGTMPDTEKAIIEKLATDVIPLLCADITTPVQLEAGGSEGNWGENYGYQRNVTLKFSNIPGWVSKA